MPKNISRIVSFKVFIFNCFNITQMGGIALSVFLLEFIYQ